jgi:hypothetical protein
MPEHEGGHTSPLCFAVVRMDFISPWPLNPGGESRSFGAPQPSRSPYQGLEGCNEILNDTRPDVLADIHDVYFAVGIDAVETNTFAANWPNLSDYCRSVGRID